MERRTKSPLEAHRDQIFEWYQSGDHYPVIAKKLKKEFKIECHHTSVGRLVRKHINRKMVDAPVAQSAPPQSRPSKESTATRAPQIPSKDEDAILGITPEVTPAPLFKRMGSGKPNFGKK